VKGKTVFAVACAIGFGLNCATYGIVEAQSAKACDAYARKYAHNASRQGQVVGRGAFGSLVGLGIGAAFGGPGMGAAIGGGVGVISGGSARQRTADRMYNAAYQDCMAGRIR
jgi:hypothetical protein